MTQSQNPTYKIAIEKLVKLVDALEARDLETYDATCDEITTEEWDYLANIGYGIAELARNELTRVAQEPKIHIPKGVVQ